MADTQIKTGRIFDFIEDVQDAVALMLDANTLAYTDATPLLAVKLQMSLTSDASGIKLVNDSNAPGNNKIYGTDGSGIKGWYNSPSGADGNGIYSGSGNIGNNVANSSTVATLPLGTSSLTFRWNNGNDALFLDQGGAAVEIRSKLSNSWIFAGDAQAFFSHIGNTLSIDSTGILTNTNLFVDDLGNSPDDKALLEVSSNTKAFLLPRFNGTQFTTYDSTATTNGMLLYNSSSKTIKLRSNNAWEDVLTSGNAPSITASNGLTKVVNDIKLGGALSEVTTIDGNATDHLTVTGSRTGVANASFTVTNTSSGSAIKATASGAGAGVNASSNTGSAIYGASTSGFALEGYSTGAIGSFIQVEAAATNTVITSLALERATSATAADGIGNKILFRNETSTTGSVETNSIVSKWNNATHASRLSEFNITGYNIATENTLLTLLGTGKLTLPKYGVGTFTGTATKTLQVDANGNVIEGLLTPPVGSGGIYGGSGSIPDATVATLASNGTFTFDYNGGNDAIKIQDSTPAITLKSKNGTYSLAINNSGVTIVSNTNNANLTLSSSGFRAAYDDGGSSPQVINLDADGFYMTSVTKMLHPPVMTTAQRTGGTLVVTGGIVYDSDFQRLFLRVPTGFKKLLVSGSGEGGIYDGSGGVPNGTIATIASGGTFAFAYNNGSPAMEVLDTSTESRLKSKDGNAVLSVSNTVGSLYHTGVGVNVTSGATQITNALDVAKTISYSVMLTPPQITANTNNYAPTNNANSSVWIINSDAARNITGIANPTSGRIITLTNNGSFTITLKNQDTNSTAANRFAFPADIALVAGMSVQLLYDDDTDRWRCIGVGYASAGMGGIYSGSGTIAPSCVATVTDASSFRIKYSTGGNGAIQVNSTAGSENTTIRGKGNDYGNLEVTNTTAKITAGSSGQGITVSEGLAIYNSDTQQIGKKVLFTSVDTPTAFAVDQHDYNTGNNTRLRVETTVDNTKITGMTHGFGIGNSGDAEGRILYLTNVSATKNIRLTGNDANSQAEYRFKTLITLPPDTTYQFIYDSTFQRWVKVE